MSATWNTDGVTKGLKAFEDKYLLAAKRALYMAAGELLRQSTKIVPHDKGILQATGNITEPVEKQQLSVFVGYDTPYALRLHEHPEYKFQKGRQGKYLERPMKENWGNWQELVIQVISESLQ